MKADYVLVRIENFVKKIFVDVESPNLLQNHWLHFEFDYYSEYVENS